jgi:hypothetical protein
MTDPHIKKEGKEGVAEATHNPQAFVRQKDALLDLRGEL